MTTQENATTIIVSEIIKREIIKIEELFNDKGKLFTELKYNKKALNERLKKDIEKYREILQNVVDKFYWSYYEVPNFIALEESYLDEAIEHNRTILRNMTKLLKFID